MKLDRDNFRHLTGFGRDMAAYVDSAMLDLHDGVFVVGGVDTIYITHNRDHNTVSHKTAWVGHSKHQDPVNIALHTKITIIVEQGGFTEIIAVPLAMISSVCRNYYHIYSHIFQTDQNGADIDDAMYIGVTKRGWRTRWAEHLRSANAGSNYRFHKAIRQWHGVARCVRHDVLEWASTEQKAMEREERLVAANTLYPLGLNMVPGGNAGLAYLRKIGALGKNERVTVDGRQDIINRFFERTSRKGIPNPLAAANWLNADYAEKVICAGEDRLKPQQIRDARYFDSLGHDVNTIAAGIGARNVDQVRRLLAGETYSRIA